jgi:hypothetical protein
MTTASKIIPGGISAVAASAIVGDITTGIVAAGSTQATATVLTTDINVVATTALSTGVLLPVGENSKSMTVFNGGANSLLVYPPVGGTINGASANAGITLATLKGARFEYISSLTIIANLSA